MHWNDSMAVYVFAVSFFCARLQILICCSIECKILGLKITSLVESKMTTNQSISFRRTREMLKPARCACTAWRQFTTCSSTVLHTRLSP